MLIRIYRSFLTILLLLILNTKATCYPIQNKHASILYCGIGDDVYSIFGHIGVRITSENSDIVYNFGTFDPMVPNFGSKYIKGDLEYALSIEEYQNFIQSYISERRKVVEYELRLTPEDIDILQNKLQSILNSEDRFYKYQFLKNNCSTKVNQILISLFREKLVYAKMEFFSSYRRSLNTTLAHNSIYRLPINCLLGNLGENKLNNSTNTYLPDSLIKTLKSWKISQTGHTNRATFIQNIRVLYSTETRDPVVPYDYALALAICTIVVLTRKHYPILITAILGILIAFLMLYSERQEFANNYNILLFNPIDLLIFINVRYKRLLLKLSILGNCIYIIIFLTSGIAYIPLLLINISFMILKIKLLWSSQITLKKLLMIN